MLVDFRRCSINIREMMIIQEGTMGRVGLTGCAREWSATCSAAKVLVRDEPGAKGERIAGLTKKGMECDLLGC